MKRRHFAGLVGAGVLTVALAAAALAAPTVVRVGNLVIKVDGGLTPTALPAHRLAPVTLNVKGEVGTADGSQPPALKEVVLDSDRNAIINARGLPLCHLGPLQARTTAEAVKACPGAIVGRGTGTVRVAFPEQAPFNATGPITIFNGGVRGGVTTMFFHVYVDVPAPTAVVTTLKATKEHDGRFGLHSVASIPVIAGGSGSITRFEMTIGRSFAHAGRRQGFLEARCQGGHFSARARFRFRSGEPLTGTFTRPCSVAS
jgi:hypothetical protein